MVYLAVIITILVVATAIVWTSLLIAEQQASLNQGRDGATSEVDGHPRPHWTAGDAEEFPLDTRIQRNRVWRPSGRWLE